MSKVELRSAPFLDVDVRQASGSDGLRLSGLAAVYGSRADIGEAFSEEISRGAFAQPIREQRTAGTVLAMNHDVSGWTLASSRSGTMTLSDDARGLRFDAQLPQTAFGEHVAELCRTGVLGGCSFGFRLAKDGDSWDQSGPKPHRTIRAVSMLRDVGPVSFPAYGSTSYQVGRNGRTAVVPASSPERQRMRRLLEFHELGGPRGRSRS